MNQNENQMDRQRSIGTGVDERRKNGEEEDETDERRGAEAMRERRSEGEKRHSGQSWLEQGAKLGPTK